MSDDPKFVALQESGEKAFRKHAPSEAIFRMVWREGTFRHPYPWISAAWNMTINGKEYGAYGDEELIKEQPIEDRIVAMCEHLGQHCRQVLEAVNVTE